MTVTQQRPLSPVVKQQNQNTQTFYNQFYENLQWWVTKGQTDIGGYRIVPKENNSYDLIRTTGNANIGKITPDGKFTPTKNFTNTDNQNLGTFNNIITEARAKEASGQQVTQQDLQQAAGSVTMNGFLEKLIEQVLKVFEQFMNQQKARELQPGGGGGLTTPKEPETTPNEPQYE